LWDTWEDDALVRDAASGRYFRPDGYHLLNHKGPHFAVRGPLDVARSPQGRPVIVQAGSSPPGRALSARVADVVFTQQTSLEAAQAFARDVRTQAKRFGRGPDDLIIMVGVAVFVGRTQAEAEAKRHALDALIHPAVALSQLSKVLGGIDLSPYPLDRPLPADLPPGNGQLSRRQSVLEIGARENLAMLDLARRISGARGHWTLVGTAATVADQMEEWWRAGAADGFLLVSPALPEALLDFAEQVVPELQRRGITRTRYEGTTLRDHLELKRPVHPAAARRAVHAAG
jgi:FMN-dependent oxidoreductase (nitrilotriacetate monooxygenase family)